MHIWEAFKTESYLNCVINATHSKMVSVENLYI
jgi:hypothetical protein